MKKVFVATGFIVLTGVAGIGLVACSVIYSLGEYDAVTPPADAGLAPRSEPDAEAGGLDADIDGRAEVDAEAPVGNCRASGRAISCEESLSVCCITDGGPTCITRGTTCAGAVLECTSGADCTSAAGVCCFNELVRTATCAVTCTFGYRVCDVSAHPPECSCASNVALPGYGKCQ